MATQAGIPGDNPPTISNESGLNTTFNVGSRKSKLALVQTEIVLSALATACPDYSYAIKARDTAAGDVDKLTPFKDMPVKNLWTHELETLMVEGQLDFLVHSLKDVPTQLPPGCEIGAVMTREDPRDAFVLKAGRNVCNIQDLPAGSVIGTSSIRRTAQIALKHPHLKILDVRGNVPTRLAKLDAADGPFDALILAAAGLVRLDLGHRITQYLDSGNGGMLHAVGQGAIGIENRSSDRRVQRMLNLINHQQTYLATAAERSLLRTLEGGCSAPLGVETTWTEGENGHNALLLKAIVVSTDGKEKADVEMKEIVQSKEEAELFGVNVASELLRRGADKILAEIKEKRPTTVADLEEK
ncbi:porphobilinogen deaminase [Cladophialophora carrionii CBS 160.54]|uniref:Porphobilinogen deaminase n=1 Tax=Cladophialophora carrionii CBS 160.54 TaxID=1279043 RepID=V9D6E9_9EURO|nr:porphobilinogen deaminase [Cladophialophora carrionii CBS 160.54]ETI21562.1 porphobilinogen deaminase [Cladophialophora carrionii CBS 160.54]